MATVADSESGEVEEPESVESNSVTYRILKLLRGSFLLSLVAVGILLLAVGMVFEIANVTTFEITSQDGVIAGMLGVFGISSIIAGGLFYVVIQLIQRK
ncbi:hypothetical protein [Natrononativus amylolyticus]|uniref:hypothetical protein n=1 Tax=Natrononativus amylolyticus TaxID=2963434 RepID=UPI0020CBE976|nr:hypothetical protein [Natrononativus amylolyticus]